MRQGRWLWTTGFALALGCASPEAGNAQEPPPANEAAATAERYTATVKDKYLAEQWRLREAKLFVPEVSLFGGGGGEEAANLTVKVGAAELEVPLARVARLEVGDQDEDELHVKITLRGEGQQQEIQGTIRSSLELHGLYGESDLKAVVRLREVSFITLEKA
jgi:hypothetical protein